MHDVERSSWRGTQGKRYSVLNVLPSETELEESIPAAGDLCLDSLLWVEFDQQQDSLSRVSVWVVEPEE